MKCTFSLTNNGRVFINTKGFEKEQKQQINQSNRQSLATWLIVVGTLLAGIYSCNSYYLQKSSIENNTQTSIQKTK
jgi:hypothetical protein